MSNTQADPNSSADQPQTEGQLRKTLYETQIEIERLQQMSETAKSPEEARGYFTQLAVKRATVRNTEAALQRLAAEQPQDDAVAKSLDRLTLVTRGMRGAIADCEINLTPALVHVPTAICSNSGSFPCSAGRSRTKVHPPRRCASAPGLRVIRQRQ